MASKGRVSLALAFSSTASVSTASTFAMSVAIAVVVVAIIVGHLKQLSHSFVVREQSMNSTIAREMFKGP